MEIYRQEREKQQRNSRVAGASLTVVMVAALGLWMLTDGMKYLDPPPPEKSLITLDFSEIEEPKVPEQVWNGTRPTAEKPDPTRETELVQRSEAPVKGSKANEAQESTVDDFGDVETPEPEREEVIDNRALFSAAKNNSQKDTLAPQTSSEPSDALKAGHASGNTTTGKTSGEPNAKLAGRSVNGTLPKPIYSIQESGRVVVKIKVDRSGNVVEAIAGDIGTTLNNKAAWEAAQKAAMKASFNKVDIGAEFQYGTITYIFKINR